jgi:hypothetical protein
MVLADDANDQTRLTWNSVVDPEVMRQAMVKNKRDMLKVLARLQDEKVIEHAGGGHNGKVAKFRFLHLDSEGCPGESSCGCPLAMPGDSDPATSLKGVQNEPPTDPAGGPVGRSIQTPYGGEADQKEHPTEAEGCSFPPGRVSDPNTPTPSPPTTSSSTTAAGTPDSGSHQEKQPKPSKHQVADDLTAAFWKHHGKGRAQPFLAVRGVIRTAISNGVDRDQLARALDQVAREGRSISGATLDIALGNLRRGAYQNPDNQDAYDEDLIR